MRKHNLEGELRVWLKKQYAFSVYKTTNHFMPFNSVENNDNCLICLVLHQS